MTSTVRPRIATAWLGGCSGCHMSFLDLDERLIDLAAAADLVYSPILDAKAFPEGVDVTLVEGAVANEDNLRDVRAIRTRTRVLVAFGDCAAMGNVTALRNLFALDDVLDRSYRENATAVVGVPTGDAGGDGVVPRLLPRALRVQDVVHVDHFLPGCPPSPDAILALVTALLAGQAPAGGGRFGA